MNVVPLPERPNLQNIPAMLRRFADDLERGDYGEIRTALMLLDTASEIHTFNWGASVTVFECAGLLEAAKLLTLNEHIGD